MNDKRLLLMTKRELSRLDVIKDVLKKRITQKNAARQLNLSIWQVKRVVKRVKQDGDEGIISRKRLAPSNRKIPEAEKMEVLNLIRDKYYDFPPTLATEKLEELNNLVYSRETIRQWMIAEGLWKPKARKKIKKVFQQRKRRASAGELIQIDGSPHAWFEDRAPVCNMTVFIDDATGEYAVLMLSPSETLQAYQQAMYQYIKEYGKPRALYSDRHSIFKVNKGEMKETKVSQFGRAMKELDIELIFAATPEAKGRVERANQTLQNRLVKEFRLRNINTIEDANKFLKEYKYVLTNKFAKVARSSVDAHRSIAKSDEELLRILSRKEERIITKNLDEEGMYV